MSVSAKFHVCLLGTSSSSAREGDQCSPCTDKLRPQLYKLVTPVWKGDYIYCGTDIDLACHLWNLMMTLKARLAIRTTALSNITRIHTKEGVILTAVMDGCANTNSIEETATMPGTLIKNLSLYTHRFEGEQKGSFFHSRALIARNTLYSCYQSSLRRKTRRP
jgi:hypothetical protein